MTGRSRLYRILTVLPCMVLMGMVGLGSNLAQEAGPADAPYPHGDFEDDCTKCHSSESWSPAVISDRFNHGRSSDFPLEGAHQSAMCRSCHLSLDFSEADPRCVTCHLDAHNGELGVDCAQCHSTANFINRADDVRSHRTTRFPLTGNHATLDCLACHPMQPSGGLRFVNTRTECEACHLESFMRTTEPNHVTLDFDRDCAACHGTTTWSAVRSSGFDHTVTGFSLAGAHAGLDCAQCHAGGEFAGVGAECLTCHQQDYDATRTPDHRAGGFPTDCQQCHLSPAWSPAEFDHSMTGFPLTGSHGGLTCEQCHTNGTPAAIEATCISCHRTDYDGAPNHVSSNFQTTCEECHNTVVWGDAAFNHDFFPFNGGHSGLACDQCHTTGVFGSIPADCQSCHQSDYSGAPDHLALNFPHDCEACHNTSNWQNTSFLHSFSLSGPHGGRDCSECHVSGTTEDFSCYGSCHEHSQSRMNDKHSGESGYAYDFQLCLSCHPDGRD